METPRRWSILLMSVVLMSMTMVNTATVSPLPNLETLYQFEEYAEQHLDAVPWAYLRLAHTYGMTKANNEAAFQKIQLQPKRMVRVSHFDSATTVLGQDVSMPIGFSPVAFQKLFQPAGEVVVGRAASSRQTIHILSQWASVTLEENAEGAPNATLWQQVQISIPKDHTENIIQRAEAAGCQAIVLTIDDPVPRIVFIGNLNTDGYFDPPVNMQSQDIESYIDADQSWDDVKWLTTITKLPIVVKGLLDADQVKDAKKAGASAIIVSNHGGRVLDGAPASIEMLAEVVDAVKKAGGGMEVYLDSGVRKGLDVFRALALGARFVFIGRPQVWGSVYNGQEGVEQVLDMLNREFVNTAQLSGVPNMAAINKCYLRGSCDRNSKSNKKQSHL